MGRPRPGFDLEFPAALRGRGSPFTIRVHLPNTWNDGNDHSVTRNPDQGDRRGTPRGYMEPSPDAPSQTDTPSAASHAEDAEIPLAQVETPAALVDLDRARENAGRVVDYLSKHGLTWRPHVKTHKSLTLARIQLESGASGLTVATLHEAEVMSTLEADLLLAHPPVGRGKETRLSRFLETRTLSVALDSRASLETVARAGQSAGRTVPILVEIDVGMGRVGTVTEQAALDLARNAEESPHTSFRGILFYPGHIRTPAADQGQALAAVGDRLSRVLDVLRGADLPPAVVSGGSTPTLWQSHRIPGVTEVRAGTCIFHDRDTLALGVCSEDQIAYRILASVVSTAVPGQAVVDAGSKALAKESFRSGGQGFGRVWDHPEVVVRSVSEEHGILDLSQTDWVPEVGDLISILPNHVCVSVNLQDRLLATTEEGLRPVALEARGR
jgi:D-serine deaminase-like pyridoxal phosphate-dependent protein